MSIGMLHYQVSFFAALLPIIISLHQAGVLGLQDSRESTSTFGRDYWEKSARQELEDSLRESLNTGLAKNVIIFIGDGMGPNTITAARIYSGGEESYLSWERFPHVGLLKTYAANQQVPDSANTATALFTGVKSNLGTLGVDSIVQRGDCEGSLRTEARLQSIASHAQAVGKATGIVTTTRVTHATPAGMYAHSAEREWECDSELPSDSKCKDIGRQLIEDFPGKDFNVIMGGGGYALRGNDTPIPEDPMDSTCTRTDGRNLINEWAEDKASRGSRYAVVYDTKSLRTVKPSKTDYLMGIFSNNHMKWESDRDQCDNGMPSLAHMATTAVQVLMNNKNGFLLMVESGLIDIAHHHGKAHKALREVVSLNEAINATVRLLQETKSLDDTLLIVTSDHSHTLTIGGYPKKGNNILGLAGKDKDSIPYTTLSYANSGKNNYHYKVMGDRVVRDDPRQTDTTALEYGVQAGVLVDQNTHGGSDILAYARGPYAHLFHHLHEQNYLASVVKYAAKIGEYAECINTNK